MVSNFLQDFSPTYQSKILNFRRWQDAQLSLHGRMPFKFGIKKRNHIYFENDLKYTEHNKPFIEDGIIQFNISHSGNLVICAISSNSEIGIDVELINELNI